MKNEITKPEAGALAIPDIDQMFGGEGYEIPIDAPLPQLTILRETPQFGTPEGETVKSVIGHIIHWHHANQYYVREYGDGEQGPPTCASSNGIVPNGGEEPFTNACRDCQLNVYGSAKEGRGKACQNTIRLYVLLDGQVIPCLIKASPASLSKKDSLINWLTNAPNVAAAAGVGTKYQPIKVKFSLHEKKFDSGFSASVLDLETVRVLDPNNEADVVKLQSLGQLWQDFMSHYVGRIRDDVAAEVDDGESDDTPF